jgi:hypothetical protein
MVKTTDILKLADESKGYVNIAMIVEAFGVDERKACEYLFKMWERGRRGLPDGLLPTNRSYFARPAEGGLPMTFGGQSGSGRGAEGWYHEHLERVRELPTSIGYTKKDLEHMFGWSAKVSEGALQRMRQFDGWEMRQSTAGGYINKPFIWGATHEAIDRREQEYIDLEVARQRKRSMKGQKKKKQTVEEEEPQPVYRKPRMVRDKETGRMVVSLRQYDD